MLVIKSNRDLWITRGDDAYLDLEIRQQNFPYDIYNLKTGDSALLTVRKSREEDIDDSNPILVQIPFVDGNFHIGSKDTENLDFGNYSYDIQVTFANGDINTIIGPNIFRILPEVTY